jgi:pimeloyl-ACP methyl ester carboxylesterase
MVRVRRAYTDGRFGQLHYRIAGSAAGPGHPPLYCLHQSPKCGLEFEMFMAVMGRDRIVVAPDYPGYGNSDAPPEESAATVPAYAEACWQIARAFGHTKIDLFGNHTGSKVAVEMALKNPDGVRQIVMISAALLTPEERAQFVNYFQPVPLDEAGTRFSVMWQRISRVHAPGVTLETKARSLMMNLLGGEAYEWGHMAAFSYNEPFAFALKTLPHRITILNPVDDLTKATRRAAPLLRHGEIIECPDWGHYFLESEPEKVAVLLSSILNNA